MARECGKGYEYPSGSAADTMGCIGHPFEIDAEAAFFKDASYAGGLVTLWTNAAENAASAAPPGPVRDNVPSDITDAFLAYMHRPDTPKPYHVVCISFPDGTELMYAEHDLATTDRQLQGRVIEISDIDRRVSSDGVPARTITKLVLENSDRSLNGYFQGINSSNRTYLHARVEISLNFTDLPLAARMPVAGVFMIDKAPKLSGRTIELQLADRLADVTGTFQWRPKLRDIEYELTSWGDKRLFVPDTLDDSTRDKYLPLFIGDELVQPIIVSSDIDGLDPDYYSWTTIVKGIIGVSRRAGWVREGELQRGDTYRLVRKAFHLAARMDFANASIKDDTLTLFGGSAAPTKVALGIRCSQLPRPWIDPDPEPWYVAWFYIARKRHDDYTYDYCKRQFIDNQDTLYFQLGHGAEGWLPAQPNGANPMLLPRMLVEEYTEGGNADYLHVDESDAALYRNRHLGGTIKPDAELDEVLAQNTDTHGIDMFWEKPETPGSHSRIRFRPRGISERDLAVNIPAANHYGEAEDIEEGTWSEELPQGNERWGIANCFRFKGIKEWYSEEMRDRLGTYEILQAWDYEIELPDGTTQKYENTAIPRSLIHGRKIERDINLTWLSQVTWDGQLIATIATNEYGEQESIATFTTGLIGLREELGNYIRVTTRDGFHTTDQVGYVRRLFRVDGISYSPRNFRVTFRALDCSQFDTESYWLLDDEDLYIVSRNGTAYAEQGMVYGTDTNWYAEGVRGSVDTEKADMWFYVPGILCERIRRCAYPNMLELVNPEAYCPTYPYYIIRGFGSRPNNTIKPGYYVAPDESRYAMLCDERDLASDGKRGAFEDGTPGYALGAE
jgi:hypothetical protein